VANDTYLNPWFVLSSSWDSGAAAAVERFGLAVNAPLDWYATWLTDPMLAAVLALAVAIRRAAQSLGRGMIERCWTCYVAGVFLTSVANIGAWAAVNVYIAWPYSALTWYKRFPPAAAFALAPLYQAAAVRQAKRGLARGAPG